jgi:DNA-binding LacI/PurR family transcriptional regulator
VRHRLKDVAERAGVSVKTVSNVVNGYLHVRPDTRARVEEAIAELNYRPNLSARNLRKGRTGVIALAVPELDIPYFAELARHVVVAAAELGWTVLIDQTGGARERERVVAAGIGDHLIDGLIFSPLALTAEDLTGLDGTPMVLLGERVDHGPADHVVIDNVAAAREITTHLVGLGRRRIAAIGRSAPRGPARVPARRLRRRLADAGIGYDERLVAPPGLAPRGRRRRDAGSCWPRYARRGFLLNDTLALGALRALHEAGLRSPRRRGGRLRRHRGRPPIPTLSTIAPDKERIARLAVETSPAGSTATATPTERTLRPYRLNPAKAPGPLTPAASRRS